MKEICKIYDIRNYNFPAKWIKLGGEKIQLSDFDAINFFLVYSVGEAEVTVRLGWIKANDIEWLHVNRVKEVRVFDRGDKKELLIYIDFEKLFWEEDEQ